MSLVVCVILSHSVILLDQSVSSDLCTIMRVCSKTSPCCGDSHIFFDCSVLHQLLTPDSPYVCDIQEAVLLLVRRSIDSVSLLDCIS